MPVVRNFSRLSRIVNGQIKLWDISSAARKRLQLEAYGARRLLQRSNVAASSFVGPTDAHQVLLLSSSSPPGHLLRCTPRDGPKRSGPDAGRPRQDDTDSGKQQDPDGDENKAEMGRKLILMVGLSIALYMLMSMQSLSNKTDKDVLFVSWNEFYHNMLAKGEVEKVVVVPEANLVTIILAYGAIIKGEPVRRHVYYMKIYDVDHFEAQLRQAERQLGVTPGSVPIIYSRQNGTSNFIQLLLMLGGAAVIYSMLRKGKGGAPGGIDFFSQLTRAKFTVVDQTVESSKPKVRFSDVAGCHGAKQEVAEFIDYLQDSTKYKRLGARVPKGVLLLGPPGCGKTMLAKAVASEAKVPFLAMAGSEFIEMIGGLGAARVRDLFKEARKMSPCIIYIDEIDAIGRRRASSSHGGDGGEEEQTLNQLLVEMDGMATKEGVLMLASTNRAEVLDKALLRPGRFDRHIIIDLPNLAERIEIYEKHLADIVLDKHPSRYAKRLAELTPGFSGADIANVCNEAALHAARTEKRSVEKSDIEYAVERVVGGTERKTHAMSPEERKRVAVHESGHALVAWLMEHTDNLLKLSIVARTKGALGMARYVPAERYLYTTDELFEKICMGLGGRAAEVVVYGQPSTGAQDDLKKVTEIAKNIVEQYGMDSTIGPLSFPDRKPYSKKLANTMDFRASQLVQHAYNTTVDLIRKNSDKLKLLADELIKKETMDYHDVEAILGPRPFGRKPFTSSSEEEADES